MLQPAVQAFSLSAQFARESAMLKLPEERRKWGESKGAGRGRGERRENGVFFFSPPPPPFPSFALAPTVRVHKIKDGGYNNITNKNKVSPTQNTPALHYTLNMLKCLRRILEMRGSAGLYVTTNGTTSLEALGLVCNALVREILAARRNCFSRKLLL